MNAMISDCGNYRYWLYRELNIHKGTLRKTLVVFMLNPSTADATVNDPTILAIMAFARLWGYDDVMVINLYAYRSTDPKELRKVNDPNGKFNDEIIRQMVAGATVLCAWGANAPAEREQEAIKMLLEHNATPVCLGLTKNGNPKHPLYVKRDTPARKLEIYHDGDNYCFELGEAA